MRFWLKDSERRPDPAPVKTDDRKAFLVGTVAWLVALAVFLVLLPTLADQGNAWWLWTCAAGLVIGVIGLGWSVWRRRAQ
ncbi:hypothetical protein BH09ACT5_BH09ACT5_24510 [soil metagenome]